MLLTEETTEVQVSFATPFAADKETFDLTVNVSGCDESFLSLTDWNCSEVDEESDTSLITCSFHVNSGQILDLEQLPSVNVILSDRDGVRKHSLLANFEIRKSINLFTFIYFDAGITNCCFLISRWFSN